MGKSGKTKTAKTGDGIAGEIPKDKKKTGKGKPDGTGDAGHEDLLVDGDHSGSGSTFQLKESLTGIKGYQSATPAWKLRVSIEGSSQKRNYGILSL
ncbi:hypothetical protein ADUPG1_002525, partial [Aduncisulcus paluster]